MNRFRYRLPLMFVAALALALSASSQVNDPFDSATPPPPPIGAGKLDGRVYVGTVGLVGDPSFRRAEKVVFQRGMYTSFTFEDLAKFIRGPYEVEAKPGGEYRYSAEIRNNAGGTIRWAGSVTDDSLVGKGTWIRGDSDTALIWLEAWREHPFDHRSKWLDGMKIIGTLTELVSERKAPEELRFDTGKGFSLDAEQHGFTWASYHVNPRYDTLYLTMKTEGPNDMERQWSGWIHGTTVEASMFWDKNDGSPVVQYTFTGKLDRQGKPMKFKPNPPKR